MATLLDIEQAILDRFAVMWESLSGNIRYTTENDDFKPSEDESWARILFRYATNTRESVGQTTRRRRTGLVLIQINIPKNTSVADLAPLEDAIVAEFENVNKRTLNVKFADVVPTRVGVIDNWMRSDVSITFSWDAHV